VKRLLFLALAVLPCFAATDTLEPVKKGLAADAARSACEEMRFRIKGRTLAIAPFRNDPEGLVTAAFKEAISSKGDFDVKEPSTWREVWDKIVGNDKDAPLTWKQAVELGTKLDAECVLFGRVETLAVDEGRSYVDVKIRIVYTKDSGTAQKAGDGLFIGRYQTSLKKSMFSMPYFQVWIFDTSRWVRVLIWCVALLILPFLTLLARDSLSQAPPIIPIGLVILMTGMDMFLALLLMGFEAGSILSWLLLVGALAVSIFYNLTILAKVAQLQLPGRD